MEQLISKDIFNTNDLLKLGPDYLPTHFVNRMHVRSLLVRDTHSPGKRMTNKNLNRKSMKRLKDGKINSELLKLRDGFQNMNLKNQIMLKKLVNKAQPLTSSVKLSIDLNTSGDNSLQFANDIDIVLSEMGEDKLGLEIHNDVGFKIHNKPNIIKERIDHICNQSAKRNKNQNSIKTTKNHCSNNDDEAVEEIFKIDFKINTPEPECNEINKVNLNETNLSNKPKTYFDQNKTGNFYLKNAALSIQNENNDDEDLKLLMSKKFNTKQKEEYCFDNVETCISQSFNEFIITDLKSSLTKGITDKQKEVEHCFDNAEKSISQDLKVFDELKETSLKLIKDPVINIFETEEIISGFKSIKIKNHEKQISILKKYVGKWKAFVNTRKNKIDQQRQDMLNQFFDKLTKKKKSVNQPPPIAAKLSVRDYNKYQHRYKVQKHVIALQKAKLEEQNRIIEKLKYNKIVEESHKSVDELKEEVLKTYYEVDRQLKPKMRCLTNELKLTDVQEPDLVLHCLKVPQFLQRMEKRAREREEKHAIIRERRKQMEEERIRLKQQAELEKIELDKDEKIKRMKELRQKRKKEKIENIRRKQHAERMRALNVMADLHYEKNLMAKYGIRPFRLLIEMKKDNIEKAKRHYNFQLKKNLFLRWMFYTEDMWYERNFKAEDYCRKKLLRQVFDGFRKNHFEYLLKYQVAEDYYDLYVTQLVFKKFREGFLEIKKEQELKWQKAVLYNNSNLLFKTFTCWRTLPALNALKREQEVRKARWREKVLQVVPDYTPPED